MNEMVKLFARRQAQLAASSLNIEARTVEAIVATENLVPRYGVNEQLELTGANLERFIGGPVLNSHRQNDANDQLGIIEHAEIKNNQLHARLRFFKGEDGDAMLEKIADGFRGVSVGYSVEAWRDGADGQGGRVRIATKWTPHEVSLVAVPADHAAHIRSHNMPEENTPTSENSPNPAVETQTRAGINEQIRSIAEIAGLDDNFANGLIDRQVSIDEARAAAFSEMQSRSQTPTPIRTQNANHNDTFDNPEFRARAIGEALYSRVNASHEPSEQARAFVGLTMPEIGREILKRNGTSVTGLSAQAIITRALHTTSDFSLILGDTVNRTLRAAYDAAPSGLRQIARQTNARDFRAKHRLQLSEAPTLEKVGEGGEFKHGGMSEAGETYKIDTFGRIVGISRQALVNDDIGAFSDLSSRLGRSARAFENKTLVDLLESNPAMSDGEDLFSAAHGNIAGAGAAPSETTLSNGRLAMRKQTGLTSELISVTPKFVLVPSALETSTEKLLTTIQAQKTSDVNPFSNLMLLVEPRLSDEAAWYVATETAEIDGLEYAYLEGEPGPQIESRNGFEIDGVEIKVRLDFGAGFVEHRGWYKNDGE